MFSSPASSVHATLPAHVGTDQKSLVGNEGFWGGSVGGCVWREGWASHPHLVRGGAPSENFTWTQIPGPEEAQGRGGWSCPMADGREPASAAAGPGSGGEWTVENAARVICSDGTMPEGPATRRDRVEAGSASESGS